MSKKLNEIINNIGSRYYKVGSVVITSTNSDPSSIYGGTWELVRKRFKEATVTDAFTFNTTNTQNGSSVVKIEKDSITIRVLYAPKVAFADTTLVVATLDPTKIGIAAKNHIYSYVGEVACSDGLNSMSLFLFSDCVIRHYEVITKTTATSVAASTTSWGCTFNLMFNSAPNTKIDSFCDEFWWVRTA